MSLKIACVLMVKNEGKRIEVTLMSIKDEVDGIIVFDTGSEDNTINIMKEFSVKHKLHFHLLHGEFEDFAKSRNRLLTFAENFHYDYFLLLDSNDEYKCNKSLKDVLKDKCEDCFFVHQKLYIGTEYDVDFYNIKVIKGNIGLRYTGVVHEYIQVPPTLAIGKLDSDIIIFQDRVQDNDGKSKTRWTNDIVLLEKEINRDSSNTRTQYYLAQTYDCLGMKKEAMIWYKLRSTQKHGFFEERFCSLMKCGDLESDEDNRVKYYLKAFEVIERAEPLIEITKIYRKKDKHVLAFIFAKLACTLSFPSNCHLWVNHKCYNHDRWQELGIVSYYVKEFDIGKTACLKAIESGYDSLLNKKNLTFYEKNVVEI